MCQTDVKIIFLKNIMIWEILMKISIIYKAAYMVCNINMICNIILTLHMHTHTEYMQTHTYTHTHTHTEREREREREDDLQAH